MKLSYQVYDTKNKNLLEENIFDGEIDSIKLPEGALFKSWTTVRIYNNNKLLKEYKRKQLFKDLPKYNLPNRKDKCIVGWRHLEAHFESDATYSEISVEEMLNPDFQRGHIWTEAQQIAYLEHVFRGGTTGKTVYFNCKGWDHKNDRSYPVYCIDGLQRITTARRFLNNELPVFGYYFEDFESLSREVTFEVITLDYPTRKDVLEWYLFMNDTGTPHTKEELDRVRDMIEPGVARQKVIPGKAAKLGYTT